MFPLYHVLQKDTIFVDRFRKPVYHEYGKVVHVRQVIDTSIRLLGGSVGIPEHDF